MLQETHLLCMHKSTSQTHRPVKKAAKSIFSFLKKKPPVNEETGFNGTFTHTFCDNCTTFWKSRGLTESEAKERTLNFRTQNHCHGPLSPMAGYMGSIVLVPDVVTAVQVSGSGGSSTAEARQQAEAERHGRELAPWWRNDEAMMPVEDTQEQDQAGSDPSNVTVWPVVTHQEEIDLGMQRLPAGGMSRDQYYRAEDLGVEMQNLGNPPPSGARYRSGPTDVSR
jgi:hypothetical protein